MGFLRNRLLRRFSIVGRVADAALVGGMALRLAQRKGWINSDRIAELGIDELDGARKMGMAEMALAGAAALRLLRRKK